MRKISILIKTESYITVAIEAINDKGKCDLYQIHRRKSGYLITYRRNDDYIEYCAYETGVEAFNALSNMVFLDNGERLSNLDVIHEIFSLLVC